MSSVQSQGSLTAEGGAEASVIVRFEDTALLVRRREDHELRKIGRL